MAILVTGANGFVGSRLVPALLKSGMKVRSFILPGTRSTGLSGSEVVSGEMDEASLIPALAGIDLVINLAGNMIGSRKERYLSANVRSVENLMKAISNLNEAPRVLHVSSVSAMGPAFDGKALAENANCSPVCLYGRTKLLGERILSKYHERIRMNLIRPCSLYGPGDKCFLGVFKFAGMGKFFRFCTRDKLFNLLYIDDFIAILLFLIQKPPDYLPLNVGNPEVITANALKDELTRVTGVSSRSFFFPPGAGRLLGRLYDLAETITGEGDIMSSNKIMELSHSTWLQDFSKLQGILPNIKFTPFREGVSKTWNWYHENGWV